MKKIHLALVSLAVAMLAAGCGGGGAAAAAAGKTTIPTAAVQINSGNASKAANAGGASQSMSQAGGGKAGTVGVVVQSSAPPKALWQRALKKFEQAQSLTQSHPAGVVGVIAGWSPMVMPCAVSGTSTFDIQDTNNSNAFDAGDAFVLTDASCVDVTGYSTNGTITMALGANFTLLNCPATPASMSLTTTFTNYVDVSPTETLTTNGDMTISLTDDCTTMTATISGSNFEETSTLDGVTQMSGYNISYTEPTAPVVGSVYSYSIIMTVASVELGGAVAIATGPAISGNYIAVPGSTTIPVEVMAGEPTAGAIVITGVGAGGVGTSTLTLTANANGIDVAEVLDVDGAAGPTPPDTTLAGTTWSAI